MVNRRFEKPVSASYSITQIAYPIDNIKHPVIREALKMLGLTSNLEIISIAEVPAKPGWDLRAALLLGFTICFIRLSVNVCPGSFWLRRLAVCRWTS